MVRFLLRCLSCALLLIAASQIAAAQTARFTGEVTDPQGAAIANADVTIVNLETNTRLTAQTDAGGQFSVPYLAAGHYQIEVHAEGFGAVISNTLELGVGQAYVYSPQLKVGTQASQVTVQAGDVAVVETSNAEVGGTITGKEVTNLGLNGRNFVQFIDLTPGVSNQTGQDEAKVGQAGSVAYSINGGRTEYNSFLIDGSDVLNVGLNKDHSTLVVYPSIDAIQEIKVLTSNYGAQYQSTGSGTTMVTVRSGTDALHGTLYEFLRNEDFNAKGYFDVTKGAPLYRRNDFGGSVGGPVVIPKLFDGKGKTHFFFSEEARLEKSPTAYRQAVPSLAERNGDFSDVCPGGGFSISQRAKYPDCPLFMSDLGVQATNTNSVNFFPKSAISQNAQAILNTGIIPFPNATTGCDSSIGSCYNVDVSLPTYWREELFRLDHTINSKLQASFHYIHDEWDETAPVPPYAFVQNSLPTINSRYYAPGLSIDGRLTAAISPTLLNEFIASYTDSRIKLTNIASTGVDLQRPAELGGGCNAATGECGLTTIFNNNSAGLDGVPKLPGLVIAGNNAAYGGNGFGVDPGYLPWDHTNPVISFTDNVTRILGRHTLQMGAQWVISRRNQDNTPIGAATGDTQGILRFDNTACSGYTGNAFADFLTLRDGGSGSNICSFQQDSGQARYHQRFQIVEPYVQDDFRINSRLTVNGGLRLSLFGTFHSADDDVYNWVPSKFNKSNELAVAASIASAPNVGQLIDPVSLKPITINQANPQQGLDPRVLNGLEQCGTGGVPSSCMAGHLFNPAPRIGFAWDVFGDGRTSVRAGYGVFFEHGTADESNTGSLEASAPKILDMTQNAPNNWNSIGGGAAFPLNVTAIPTQVTWAYVQQWSGSIERQLPKSMLLSVAYVGSKGTHLAAERQINQLAPLNAAQNPFGPHQPLFKSGVPVQGAGNGGDCTALGGGPYTYTLSSGVSIKPGDPAYINMEAACQGSTPPTSNAYVDPNSLRSFAPGIGQIYSLENVADSEYNGLQVAARRTQGSLILGVAYTYSHSFDDASDRSDATFVNSFDINSNRASSNFDQRHLLHVNYIYPLRLTRVFDPLLHFLDSDPSNVASHPNGAAYDPKSFADSRAAKLVLENWEISGITTFETGIPFTVVNNGSPNGESTLDNAGVANGQGSGSYPDIVGSAHGHIPAGGNNGSSVGPLLLNPGAFVAPRGLTFGNAGRNVLNNPRRTNSDVTLMKNFHVSESASLQFRAEAFNVFNQTQFRIYDPLLGNQAQNTLSCYGGYASGYSGAGGDGVDCLTGKSFLHPVDAHRPRTMQFALKLLF